jgi:hypothetical protein
MQMVVEKKEKGLWQDLVKKEIAPKLWSKHCKT